VARVPCVICSYVMSYDVVLPAHPRHILILHTRAVQMCSKKTLYYTLVQLVQCWVHAGYGYRMNGANKNSSSPSNAEWAPMPMSMVNAGDGMTI